MTLELAIQMVKDRPSCSVRRQTNGDVGSLDLPQLPPPEDAQTTESVFASIQTERDAIHEHIRQLRLVTEKCGSLSCDLDHEVA